MIIEPSNLPPLPTGWHWEYASPCYTTMAVMDKSPYDTVTIEDGLIVIRGEEWNCQSAPIDVALAVMKAHGVSL